MTTTVSHRTRKPIRLVHLGLGAFFRAHQARLTQLTEDASDWGYAAFTVRSPHQAEQLHDRDCLYTLIERSGEGDDVMIVDQLSAVHDGADLAALRGYLADPAVAVVTLTITEAGYGGAGVAGAGSQDDVALVRRSLAGEPVAPRSPLARLLVGLDARRVAGAGPLAVVSCDNLPDNGEVARNAVTSFAAGETDLIRWIDENVSFVSTAVDRITPRLSAEGSTLATAQAGYVDPSAVVTEPYAEWVLAGEFPAGRPRWETAGAVFTGNIEPYARRKLRMLNGAHTLLAIAGLRRGFTTIDEAIGDSRLAALADDWWCEAARTLPPDLDADAYAQALRKRFANGALRHLLAQIAENMTAKLESRIIPVIREGHEAGLTCPAGLRVLAEWAHASDERVLGRTMPGLLAAECISRLVPTAPMESIEHALELARI